MHTPASTAIAALFRPAAAASTILARSRSRYSLRADRARAFSYVEATLTDATALKLCRLRYVGSAHHWQFAICRASHDDYDESISPPA